MKDYILCTHRVREVIDIPLADRKNILVALVLLISSPLAQIQMVYSVLHWRLGKAALVAAVLATVYIITEPPSGR